MTDKNKRSLVAVIGGGPAGLMAAGTAALAGASVMLFEKNARCGKKLLLTGAGKCNVANSAPFDEFMEQFPENRKFLYPAFQNFFTGDLEAFFNRHQVILLLDDNGKYFPETNRSSSILDALMAFCTENQVDFHFTEPVLDIRESPAKDDLAADGNLVPRWGIRTDSGTYFADSVIVATGGLSYPRTGSDGDGYRIASNLSHSIVPVRPALVPVEVTEQWCSRLSGISLKGVAVILWESGADLPARRVAAMSGDLLFTHFGLSGPVILFLSRWIKEHPAASHNYFLTADLIPRMPQAAIENMLLGIFAGTPNRQLKTVLGRCFEIPHAFASVIVECCGMDSEVFCREVTKEQRKKLLGMLKAFHFTITRTRGYDEAMVTAGGIDTKEISPRTMESRLHPGLYFAGEIIDIDGYTGGFNLQAAFSTGHLAGGSAAAHRPSS
ncbi:MAG: BaiN/RdsA family NAD(P)/FAD-dependent oxidoreductase [Saccharofermentanales bacterium]